MSTDFSTAVRGRRTTREFKPDAVPAELLRECLEDARWGPSWSNTQPYRVAIAQGALRDRLTTDLCSRFDEGLKLKRAPGWARLWALLRGRIPRGEYAVPAEYPADLQASRRATGFGLYEMLGIRRDDYAARDRQMRKNFEFFGAPVAMFVFAHEGLGAYAALDAGIFLQSFMLACHARGLGTCAQGALALWPQLVREAFVVPAHYRLLVGCAVGFQADDAVVNGFNPGRREVDELLLPPR